MLSRRKWLKPIILACILIPIVVFICNTDFKLVWQEISKIGFRFVYILASTFAAYLLGTMAWWVCFGDERKRIGILQLFVVRQVGETVGLYNPSSIVGGDLLKDQLLKPSGISPKVSAESIVVSRITVVLSQILLFIIAGTWLLLYTKGNLPYYAYYALLFAILILFFVKLFLFVVLNRKAGTKKVVTADINASFWRKIFLKAKLLLLEAQLFYQEKPLRFWQSYMFSLLHWVVGSIEFYLILLFLGFDIRIMHGILLDMGVIVVKSLGAFVPGQLGIEELGNKLVLTAVGIQATSVWLAVSILRRTRQLFWIVIGFFCYGLVKKTGTVNLVDHGSIIR